MRYYYPNGYNHLKDVPTLIIIYLYMLFWKKKMFPLSEVLTIQIYFSFNE